MELSFDGKAIDTSLSVVKHLGKADDHVTSAVPNGHVDHTTDSSEEKTTESNKSCNAHTDWSLTEVISASENSCILIQPGAEPAHSDETVFLHHESPADGIPTSHFQNSPPVCTPPSAGRPCKPSSQSSARKPDQKQHHPAYAASSPKSLKSSPKAAGNERCAHCILACLFCEVLSACSLLMQCLDCGQGCEPLLHCCCACEDADCGLCGADTCLAGVPCCESSSFLEVCMECCSVCFTA